MTNKIFKSVFTSCILVAAMTVGLIVIILNNYFVTIEENRIAAQQNLPVPASVLQERLI